MWEADKLERAVAWLATVPSGTAAVYGSRTTLIDPDGRVIGMSPLFRKPPTFRNALVQNIAGGNTMVLNEAARQLLIKAGGALDVPSHDWWLYQLTTASGGLMHYDTHCSVRYRRHERNLVGWNIGIVARVRRARMLIQGRFKNWTDRNVKALEGFRPHMSAENRVDVRHLLRSPQARSGGAAARRPPLRRLSPDRAGRHRAGDRGHPEQDLIPGAHVLRPEHLEARIRSR